MKKTSPVRTDESIFQTKRVWTIMEALLELNKSLSIHTWAQLLTDYLKSKSKSYQNQLISNQETSMQRIITTDIRATWPKASYPSLIWTFLTLLEISIGKRQNQLENQCEHLVRRRIVRGNHKYKLFWITQKVLLKVKEAVLVMLIIQKLWAFWIAKILINKTWALEKVYLKTRVVFHIWNTNKPNILKTKFSTKKLILPVSFHVL